MDLFLVLKTLHVIGATVLLGTGAGIAFFMVMAHRTNDPALVAHTAGVVVIADLLFTASAIVIQPLTGLALAELEGQPLFHGWIALSMLLYLVAGAFWLPVIWIQLRMRDLARLAVEQGAALSAPYHHLYRVWIAFGIPAFSSVLGIIWLMVARPSL